MSTLKKFITLGGVAAFLLLLGFQGLVTSEPQPEKPLSSSKTKLIVFVHGYRGDASTWSKFKKLVQEDDTLHDFEVHTMHYPTSILWKNPSDRQLGELLGTELVERFGAYREIYLIGHSMGGLVICSMVVEKLKAGRAQDLKKIKSIILFGTPNNGKQIPALLSWWDRQLADLSSSEQFVDELRNELIDRVYRPKITPGDENSKLPIPVTVVIGLQDHIVDEASARSFFREPEPLTVPGDHQSMKEPDNHDSLAYLVVRNKLLSSRKPDESSQLLAQLQDIQSQHTSSNQQIEPVIDLALGEPFGSKTVIRITNSGVQPVVNVAVNLRCFFLKEKNDPSPTLFFVGFPSVGNTHSWWVVDRIEPGSDYTKDAKESLANFLSNSKKKLVLVVR